MGFGLSLPEYSSPGSFLCPLVAWFSLCRGQGYPAHRSLKLGVSLSWELLQIPYPSVIYNWSINEGKIAKATACVVSHWQGNLMGFLNTFSRL